MSELLAWHDEQTCLCVAGERGSGKSSTARALITSRKLPRRIFYDPKRDFSPYAEVTVYNALAMERYCSDVENNHPFSVCYVPKDLPRPEALARCCIQAEKLEDCTIIADELHSATKQNEVHPEVVRFVRESRHVNCGFWGLSQQPHDICLDVRSQLKDEAFYMLLTEENERKMLNGRRKGLGDLVSRLPKLYGYRIIPAGINPEPFRVDPRGAARLLALDGRPLDW